MKISELAKLVGVAPSTIRYYEGKGLLPKGSRNSNGYRQYDHSSIEQIKMIKFETIVNDIIDTFIIWKYYI